jgi:hypothetical protein
MRIVNYGRRCQVALTSEPALVQADFALKQSCRALRHSDISVGFEFGALRLPAQYRLTNGVRD